MIVVRVIPWVGVVVVIVRGGWGGVGGGVGWEGEWRGFGGTIGGFVGVMLYY